MCTISAAKVAEGALHGSYKLLLLSAGSAGLSEKCDMPREPALRLQSYVL